MWAWLAEDSGTVNSQISTFVSAPSPYHWNKFAYGSEPYDTWVTDIVAPPEEDSTGKPNDSNKQSPRIDYLVVKGLAEKGLPPKLSTTVQSWTDSLLAAH